MKKHLTLKINQAIHFAVFTLVKWTILIRNQIKRVLQSQSIEIVLTILLILVIAVFIFAPSVEGGSGGGGG